jgi:hypothetical protein
MAKRSRIESALKKAQSLLGTYIPGRKRAEATLDEVLWVLGQARGVLTARGRRKAAASRRGRAKGKTVQRRKGAGRKKTSRAAAARKIKKGGRSGRPKFDTPRGRNPLRDGPFPPNRPA